MAIAFGWAAVLPHDDIGNGLAIILALCAALGSLTAAQWQGAMDVSASFVCIMLRPRRIFGPAEAFTIVVFSESVAWLSQRYRPQAFVVNLAAIGIPTLIAGTMLDALSADAMPRVEFLAVLAAAAVVNLTSTSSSRAACSRSWTGSRCARSCGRRRSCCRRSASRSRSRSPSQRCTSASASGRAPSSSC